MPDLTLAAAIVAGLVSFLSPCVLPVVPAYLGQLGVLAVAQRDYPMVLAFVMVGGFGVVLGNLLADVLYGVADPRIKY